MLDRYTAPARPHSYIPISAACPDQDWKRRELDVELGREMPSDLTLDFFFHQSKKEKTSRRLEAFALLNSVRSSHYPALALIRHPDLMDVEVDVVCTLV